MAGVGQTNPFIKVFDQFYSKFQSPYGGRDRSDFFAGTETGIKSKFQSPYGGIGRSDWFDAWIIPMRHKNVSITLRWHRQVRQVFINNNVSKPFAEIYERKVVKYIVNELLTPEFAL